MIWSVGAPYGSEEPGDQCVSVTDENGRVVVERILPQPGHMLAAAPDLLAALRRLVLEMKCQHIGDEWKILEDARAAIAKATAQEP